MNAQQRNTIFQRFQANNPNPETELIYSSTFELMIAVMLSAQATDKSVNAVTSVLFSKARSPKDILELGEAQLKTMLKSLNYYITKTKHILQTCRLLIEKHQGEVPGERKALEALPGIGRKTANVILNVAFHQPTMAVDTHIFRVANRTGLARGKTPLDIEKILLATIEPNYLLHAHHWLILHGRYVCTARNPHCATCLIRDLCEFEVKSDIQHREIPDKT